MIIHSPYGHGETAPVVDTFAGNVWGQPLLNADGTRIANVYFSPGARSFWHSHEQGQAIIVVAGRGFVCVRDADPQPIGVGDVIWTPPGEDHWHGAAADSFLVHTTISLGATNWAEPVV